MPDLMTIKHKIDNAKEELSERKGKENTLIEQMEEKWGCKTVPQAEKKLKSMNSELIKMEKELDTDTKKLTDKLKEIEEGGS